MYTGSTMTSAPEGKVEAYDERLRLRSLITGRYREAASFHAELATVDEERFVDAVLNALSGKADEELADALGSVHTTDLYLALGCLAGDVVAHRAFERDIISAIKPSVDRVCRDGSVSIEDVMQWTREKLLVGAPNEPPKLSQYTGRGALVGWVRVVAVREALQDRRRSRRERVRDDTALIEGDGEDDDAVNAEVRILRDRYADSFKAAVRQALRRLSAEQRSILRFHTHDGLTIDELAPMLGVHRATAARRLERARLDVLAHTRAILRETCGLSESEARSLCTVLGREVDVSIKRALTEEATS